MLSPSVCVRSVFVIVIILTICLVNPAYALDVNIAPDLPSVDTAHEGVAITIQRNQDENNVLSGGFSKTSRKCPPFCIQPILVAPGVTTVGELELLEFIQTELNNGTGILIDARTPSWHNKGTIPGSINIPFTTFDDDTDEIVLKIALGKLGVHKKNNHNMLSKVWDNILSLSGNNDKIAKWDFSQAKNLLLWCNGMWCGQSPRAIKGLLKLGYPAEKIKYYRGGMQSWLMLGFNVVVPTGGSSQ